jgi:hypothetical protein
MKNLKKISLSLCLFFVANALAKIETVQLFLGQEHDVYERSNVLQVSYGRVEGQLVPFVQGRNHVVLLRGDWLDTSDRVEIMRNGVITRTIRKSNYILANASGSDHQRKGQIKFRINSTDIPDVDEPGGGLFSIRVRWGVELNGFQTLYCISVRRGVIEDIKFVGGSGISLPTFRPSNDFGEVCYLDINKTYRLELNGKNFGNQSIVNSIRLNKIFTYFGGLTNALDVTAITSSRTRVTITFKTKSTKMDYTKDRIDDFFHYLSAIALSDNRVSPNTDKLRWGNYILYRIDSNKLTIVENNTNLRRITTLIPNN